MFRTLIVFFFALSLATGIVVAIHQSAKAASDHYVPAKQTKQTKNTEQERPKGQDEKKKDDDEKQEPILARFMRKKLGASNKVLKGLMTDDFDSIEQGADDLMKMSLAEEWRVSNDPTYARYSLDYQNTVRKLKVKAKKSTVDGSALAWMDVTMSCIECHDWVRNVLIADSDFGDVRPTP